MLLILTLVEMLSAKLFFPWYAKFILKSVALHLPTATEQLDLAYHGRKMHSQCYAIVHDTLDKLTISVIYNSIKSNLALLFISVFCFLARILHRNVHRPMPQTEAVA